MNESRDWMASNGACVCTVKMEEVEIQTREISSDKDGHVLKEPSFLEE